MTQQGPQKSIYAYILLVAAVTAATWALGILDIKYHHESNPGFADGFPGDIAQWSRAGDWSNVEIDFDKVTVHRESSKKSYAKRRFELGNYDNRADHKLRITGTLETVNRVEDDSDDRGAAFMVWLEGIDGTVLKYLTIQNLTGDRATYRAERIVSIPDAASSFILVLNSRTSKSSFSLTDASAEIISVTKEYKASALTLLACWATVFMICSWWLHKHASRRLFLITVILVSSIVIGVILPESLSSRFVDPLLQSISSQFLSPGIAAAEYTYKIGHFLFFFLVSLALLLNSDSLPIKQFSIICLLVLLAIASEAMQLHLFNRSTRIFDLGIDAIGIILGWCIAPLFRRKRISE